MGDKNSTASVPEKRDSLIVRILKWAFLAVVVFTCLMAAYRKFVGY
jgi:hypothetical protein